MNPELLDLLRKSGWEVAGKGLARERVLVVKNARSIPVNPAFPGQDLTLGFHLVLIDGDYRPTHYVRCCPAEDRNFQRECGIAATLSHDPELRDTVPRFMSVASDRLRLLVAEYLNGIEHTEFVNRKLSRAKPESLGGIFRARDHLCERAQKILPEFAVGPVCLRTEAEYDINSIRARHPDLDLSVVEAALRAAPVVPAEIQHGDFWSSNVIHFKGTWRIIDFDDFARVRVPLYDVFHFIQCLARINRHTETADWLGRQMSSVLKRNSAAWRRLFQVQVDRSGLSCEQISGCLAYYVVRTLARRSRNTIPLRFSAPLINDLELISRAIRDGASCASVLTWAGY